MKSLNQIYKESGAKSAFKDWLAKGQELFNWKQAEGSIPGNVTFVEFANQAYLNADAKAKKAFGDTTVGQLLKSAVKVGADVITQKDAVKAAQAAQKAGTAAPAKTGTNTGTATDYSDQTVKREKTILGMKPVVFYPVLGVTLLGVGFGVYKLVKHFSK